MAQCSVTFVGDGGKRRCIRPAGHDGGCHPGGENLRTVICDACGRPVHEGTRWRHEGCVPPALPPAAQAVIRRVRQRVGAR